MGNTSSLHPPLFLSLNTLVLQWHRKMFSFGCWWAEGLHADNKRCAHTCLPSIFFEGLVPTPLMLHWGTQHRTVLLLKSLPENKFACLGTGAQNVNKHGWTCIHSPRLWTILKTDTFPSTSFEKKKETQQQTKKQNSTPKDWKKIDFLSVKVYLLKIK